MGRCNQAMKVSKANGYASTFWVSVVFAAIETSLTDFESRLLSLIDFAHGMLPVLDTLKMKNHLMYNIEYLDFK